MANVGYTYSPSASSSQIVSSSFFAWNALVGTGLYDDVNLANMTALHLPADPGDLCYGRVFDGFQCALHAFDQR